MLAFCEWRGRELLRLAWFVGFWLLNQILNLNSQRWKHGILTTCLQGIFLFLLMKCVQEIVFFLLENLHFTEGYVFGSCVLLVSHVELRVICNSSFWIYFPCYVGGLLAMSCPTLATGVGCHVLLQGIFPNQQAHLGLLHCRQVLYQLSYKGNPCYVTHIFFSPVPSLYLPPPPPIFCRLCSCFLLHFILFSLILCTDLGWRCGRV